MRFDTEKTSTRVLAKQFFTDNSFILTKIEVDLGRSPQGVTHYSTSQKCFSYIGYLVIRPQKRHLILEIMSDVRSGFWNLKWHSVEHSSAS